MATYTEFVYSDYFKTELPSHWQEKRLGFLAEQTKNAFVDGPFGSDLKSDDYLDEGVPLIQLNNIRDGKHILRNMKFISDHKKLDLIRHLALPKDIVIAKMAEPVARATIVSDEYDEYVIVADCVKLTPNLNLVDLEFLVWAINSDCVRENAELVSTGTTRIRINLGELKKLKVPYPSLTEQIKIREYLDHETAQIDTLIAKQEKLIELLKEKRQAVISHAVTKGLNPDVAMKDSGVEWLGKVPEHWDITRIKYIAELTPKKSEVLNTDQRLCTFVPMEKLKLGSLIKDEEKPISEVIGGYTYFKDGDLLLAKVTPCFENKNMVVASGLKNGIGFGSSEIYVLRTNNRISNQFLYYRLQEEQFMELGTGAMTGAGGLKRVPSDYLNNFIFALPPLEEQFIIGEYLDQYLLKSEYLMNKAKSAIQLMQERRTALISSAVTGKIDVRNWQHPNEAKTELSL